MSRTRWSHIPLILVSFSPAKWYKARVISFYKLLLTKQSLSKSVTLHTDLGDLKIEVFCEAVPHTAEV